MKQLFAKTLQELRDLDLPIEVMKKVMEDLLYYDETHVTFENGKHHVSPNVMLCAKYPKDFIFIGTWEAKEVYSDEQERSALRVASDVIDQRMSEIMFGQEKGSREYSKDMLNHIVDTKINGY